MEEEFTSHEVLYTLSKTVDTFVFSDTPSISVTLLINCFRVMVIQNFTGIACGITIPDEIEIEIVLNEFEYKKFFEGSQ